MEIEFTDGRVRARADGGPAAVTSPAGGGLTGSGGESSDRASTTAPSNSAASKPRRRIREPDGRYYASFVVERAATPLPVCDREVGLDLAKQAVERNRELKVLYTTGQTVTDGMKALFVRNSTLLAKPYTVEQLHTILAMKFGIKPTA